METKMSGYIPLNAVRNPRNHSADSNHVQRLPKQRLRCRMWYYIPFSPSTPPHLWRGSYIDIPLTSLRVGWVCSSPTHEPLLDPLADTTTVELGQFLCPNDAGV
ncbi:hypothetical protein L210DRAFT_2210770 [Boletus edulis BED1]|uniref:Uncharacterized protein n=1 Tax=Boletus edulis BED1 TaxID=1328754 RepID=A0AAD4GEF0_BOLED|nr:hypothetical protein L210DRAFT_2210770 [Boletus edulis BED1]